MEMEKKKTLADEVTAITAALMRVCVKLQDYVPKEEIPILIYDSECGINSLLLKEIKE